MQWGANKGTDVAEEVFVEEMKDDEVVSSTENGSQWIFKPWGTQSSCATWRSALVHGGCRKRKATNGHQAQ